MISTVLCLFAEWAVLPYFLFILAHYIFWPPTSSPYNTWVFRKKNYGVRWTQYFLCERGISMIPGQDNFLFFVSFQCGWGIHKVSGIPQRASYHCQWCDWLDLFCCLVYQFLSSSHTQLSEKKVGLYNVYWLLGNSLDQNFLSAGFLTRFAVCLSFLWFQHYRHEDFWDTAQSAMWNTHLTLGWKKKTIYFLFLQRCWIELWFSCFELGWVSLLCCIQHRTVLDTNSEGKTYFFHPCLLSTQLPSNHFYTDSI